MRDDSTGPILVEDCATMIALCVCVCVCTFVCDPIQFSLLYVHIFDVMVVHVGAFNISIFLDGPTCMLLIDDHIMDGSRKFCCCFCRAVEVSCHGLTVIEKIGFCFQFAVSFLFLLF